MIIGEAPGEWEEHLGRPFVGESGQKLMEALRDAGASRTQFYITNVYKLRPLDRQGKNRSPDPKEVSSHCPYLCQELEAVRPCAVLLLGATVLHRLFNKKGIEEHHGKEIRCHGRVYLPTFHPSYILRRAPKHPHSSFFFEDVKQFVGLAG